MRILYLSHGYTAHDWRFLDLLAGADHAVWHLRLRPDVEPRDDRPAPPGVRAAAWPGAAVPDALPDDEKRAAALASAVAEIRPDLAVAGPVPSAAFLCALSGFRPYLAVAWGSDVLVDAVRDEAARRKAQYALARAGAVLCDCEMASRRVQELAGCGLEQIVELPWGADLDRFFPAPDGRGSRRFTAVSTRTWAPGYGLDTLLDAFAAAHAEEPRLRLSLLGGGPLAAGVEARIRRYGLAESVVLAGRVPERELPDRFRAAGFYISCAESDGSSVSLLQAMACGLPAAATDWPSNREWIEPGVNGWLARAGDATSFAEALLTAARLDEAAWRRMSEASAGTARRRADWRRNSQRLLAACERLAAAA